jgi:hypothetical protein
VRTAGPLPLPPILPTGARVGGQLAANAALDEALRRGRPEVFNTDQGVQFTAQAWTGPLESARVAASMDGRGRCLDNVFVERPWPPVKYEDIYLSRYEAVPQFQHGLGRSFPYYNKSGCTTPWTTGRRPRFTGTGGRPGEGQVVRGGILSAPPSLRRRRATAGPKECSGTRPRGQRLRRRAEFSGSVPKDGTLLV